MTKDGGTSKETKSKPRFWQPSWWLPELKKCDRTESCQRIAESSAPKPTYYVLIVLSTLIASYGLLSNSTATVIGAMIVAPLMGPILGLALGTVLASAKMFYRSLIAETTGVVVVILTGMVVAAVVGPSHIDFSAGEIAGRTRPTLYDFAIGLAAGLAGGYCTVHPGLQASVAGVAIAVALVPPLAVTGLTGAGWMAGELAFEPVFGSFMLFFTNLVTIELASGFVFLGTGFRQTRSDKPKEVWRVTLLVKTILIVVTCVFLTNQLTNLLQERYGLATCRRELKEKLKEIRGAKLDSIEVHLKKDVLVVNAVVGSRSNIGPTTVRRFEKDLTKAINRGLPRVRAELEVRTVNSTYASSVKYLYEPDSEITDEVRREGDIQVALDALLQKYAGVELVDVYLATSEERVDHENTPLNVVLNAPYAFGPRFVRGLQNDLNKELSGNPSLFAGYSYKLLVKTVLVKTASSEDAVAVDPPEMRTKAEVELSKREAFIRELVATSLEINGDLKVLEVHVRRLESKTAESSAPVPSPTPVMPTVEVDSYAVSTKIQSPKLITPKDLAAARDTTESLYKEKFGRELQLSIDSTISVGSELFISHDSPLDPDDGQSSERSVEEKLNQQLNARLTEYVAKLPGASVTGITGIQQIGNDKDYRLFAVITSEKPIAGKLMTQWQNALLKATPEIDSLELQVENRLGRTVRLKPSVRKKPEPEASPSPEISPSPTATP